MSLHLIGGRKDAEARDRKDATRITWIAQYRVVEFTFRLISFAVLQLSFAFFSYRIFEKEFFFRLGPFLRRNYLFAQVDHWSPGRNARFIRVVDRVQFTISG